MPHPTAFGWNAFDARIAWAILILFAYTESLLFVRVAAGCWRRHASVPFQFLPTGRAVLYDQHWLEVGRSTTIPRQSAISGRCSPFVRKASDVAKSPTDIRAYSVRRSRSFVSRRNQGRIYSFNWTPDQLYGRLETDPDCGARVLWSVTVGQCYRYFSRRQRIPLHVSHLARVSKRYAFKLIHQSSGINQLSPTNAAANVFDRVCLCVSVSFLFAISLLKAQSQSKYVSITIK